MGSSKANLGWKKQTNMGDRHGLHGPISIHYSITYTKDKILGSKVTYLLLHVYAMLKQKWQLD